MKLFLQLLFAAGCLLWQHFVHAQCTNTVLDWDHLDFFPSAGISTYTSLSNSSTQNFAFGAQVVTITHNYTGSNAAGENNTHTGHAGSYSTGDDVQFTGNGTIIFTFRDPVQNVKFSIYDVDRSQSVQFVATNGTTAMPITLSVPSGSILAMSNNNSVNQGITASNTSVANSSNAGTVNVDIAGPVTSLSLKITNTGTANDEIGSFWISDVQACSAGSFSSNYFLVSRPFTGQPGYILTVRNSNVYYVDPANGKAKFLFADNGHTNLNSMAYDPVHHFVYYVYSLTGPNGSLLSSNKTLRRYDYNMDTLGVVVPDITSLGIPTFEEGVESGAAAFYDGSLYLGIETKNYEVIVWKIDFNASFVPVSACQVYAKPGSGRDWGDIGISGGVLYDFNTSGAYNHLNLLTHGFTGYTSGSGSTPMQTSVNWQGQLYNIGGTSGGSLAPYNYNGTVNTAQKKNILFENVAVTGSWGDAAEAFKPRGDFGDAPATYDPDPLAPAVHEKNNNLRLGLTIDDEWSKISTINADGDGSDEDGLVFVPILNTKSGSYYVDVSFYNNTGQNATIGGWLDLNNNGSFDAGEGVLQTVGSSTSLQSTHLYWTNINADVASNSSVYLRIRITSASNGMTVSNATGYYSDGEVEDYIVTANISVLPLHLKSFDARKLNEQQVAINWTVLDEEAGIKYELQKSKDGRSWKIVQEKEGVGTSFKVYSVMDSNPEKPFSYYRLKYTGPGGSEHYSEAVRLNFSDAQKIKLFPNPVINTATLWVNSDTVSPVKIEIFDLSGRVVYSRVELLHAGANSMDIEVRKWPVGLYTLRLSTISKQNLFKMSVIRN